MFGSRKRDPEASTLIFPCKSEVDDDPWAPIVAQSTDQLLRKYGFLRDLVGGERVSQTR